VVDVKDVGRMDVEGLLIYEEAVFTSAPIVVTISVLQAIARSAILISEF